MARRQQLAESLVSRAGQRRASAHRPLQVGLLLVRSDTNGTLIESLEATTAIGTPSHSISTGSEESARNGILRFTMRVPRISNSDMYNVPYPQTLLCPLTPIR